MDPTPLPPIASIDELKSALAHVSERHRDDAIQEAWVAHLEGKDPIRAVFRYAKAERRNELRKVPILDSPDGPAAIEKDGSTTLI